MVARLGCLLWTGGMGGLMGLLQGGRMEWGVGTGLLVEGGRPGRGLVVWRAAQSKCVSGFGVWRGAGMESVMELAEGS